MRDPVILIASSEHPWAKRKEILVSELRDADFILREEESGTYTVMEAALNEKGYSSRDLNIVLTLGNSEAIALAVQEGLGVGFVSRAVVTGLHREGISTVNVQGLQICRDIYVGRHKRRPATAAQTAFWALVDEFKPPISAEYSI